MDDELKKVTAALSGDCTGLTPETVDALYRRWPYFTVPALMELKGYCGSVSDDRRRELMARVALNSSDPAAMAELTDTDSELWKDFYPSETGKRSLPKKPSLHFSTPTATRRPRKTGCSSG